jgi:hypothetical protein
MKAAMNGPTSSSDRGPPRAMSMTAVWLAMKEFFTAEIAEDAEEQKFNSELFSARSAYSAAKIFISCSAHALR